MKALFKSIWPVIAAMMSFVLGSCSKDDAYKVYLDYSVVCSEDLLSFVEPVVSYADENGIEKTVKLSRTDFSPSEHREEGLLEWRCPRSTFDGWGVHHLMSVRYEKKEGVSVESNRIYSMSHSIACSVTPYSETWEKGSKIVDNSSMDVHMPITERIPNEMIETYLQNLMASDDVLEISISETGNVVITPSHNV